MQEVLFFESGHYRGGLERCFFFGLVAGGRARDDPQTLAVRHSVALALPQFEAVAQMPAGVCDLVLQVLSEDPAVAADDAVHHLAAKARSD